MASVGEVKSDAYSVTGLTVKNMPIYQVTYTSNVKLDNSAKVSRYRI